MPAVTAADLQRMRDSLLFEGGDRGRRVTRFWVLLALAAVIAAAGVVADSTATVIGAMIVAPLMTPILGAVLSIVCADVPNLVRCALLVVAGAVLVVAIGWALGALIAVDVSAATNAQVAGRVHPRLIDLVAAIATGAVGAFALVRSDVSDTLPGVAIAISLVPPLAVVGLTLEAGRRDEALGALLLFLTNVAAILLTGLAVMALYRVRSVLAAPSPRLAVMLVAGVVVLLAIPLTASSRQVTLEALRRADVREVADRWAAGAGWDIVAVDATVDGFEVLAIGPLPQPSPAELRAEMDRRGLRDVDVRLSLTPTTRVELPGR